MSAAPGWYPNGDKWETYWDGTQWLDTHRPVEAATNAPEASVPETLAPHTALLPAASGAHLIMQTSSAAVPSPATMASVLPRATKDVAVDIRPEGVFIDPISWLAKGSLGQQQRIIRWDDISTIEGVSGGFKIREGRKVLRIDLAPIAPAHVEAIIAEISRRCVEATGRALTLAKITRSEKKAAIEGTFARGLDRKMMELSSHIAHGTHHDEVAASHALLLWAKAQKVKGGSDLAAVRLNELRSRMGAHIPALVGAIIGLGFHPSIQVFDDRVIMGRDARPIDAFTQAQVYVDGQVQVTMRPSMTAAAFGSILPGSALIPAMTFGKKERTDTRVAEFHIGSRDWVFKTRIFPSSISDPRAVAQRVNAIADGLEKTGSAQATVAPMMATPVPVPTMLSLPESALERGGDLTSQVERIVELERSGAITSEQATAMKARIIGV